MPIYAYKCESCGHAKDVLQKISDTPLTDCPACGKTLDVGHAQISAGLAWWYRAYAKEQSVEDRGRYESEENEARLRRRGIWADPQPVPPWEWRRKDMSKN